jgi:hypothetical protein
MGFANSGFKSTHACSSSLPSGNSRADHCGDGLDGLSIEGALRIGEEAEAADRIATRLKAH